MNYDRTPFETDKPGEECGVFGAYDFDGHDISSSIYYGLFALQHRGQESCGIAVSDTEGPKGKVDYYKDMGLVNEVFDEERLNRLHGNIGVGHVRYSTAGASNRENAQPLIIHYIKGTLAVAHNGNLTNAVDLREKLKYSGAIFQTTIDSETIAYYIARERVQTKNVQEAVSRTMDKIEGAYALAVMSPRKLIGARDPYGFKPLCIGKRDNTYFLSSETCALDAVGAEFVRDVERARSSPSRRTAFSPTNRTASPLKNRDAAFLSTFISPARTATLTASTCIPRVCLPAVSLRKIPPWMRTSSSACRNPATRQHRATPWNLASPTARHS